MIKPNVWIFKASVAWISMVVCCLILAGCASTRFPIQNVPLSFNAVKTVVNKSFPGGTARESDNGRELTSAYFDPITLKADNDPKKPLAVRAFMIVTISGSSRPYAIDLHAFRERKEKDGFEDLGEDEKLTDRLTERLRQSLADRREDRNVIDDFRVF